MTRVLDLLERLGALQRSEMRRFAQENGLQMVHLEVLTYLQRCNRYSDTTQALSEYLGQTKGSISQTVGFLETEGYLRRNQDSQDKRVYHLTPLAKGRRLAEEFESIFFGKLEMNANSVLPLEALLETIQKRNSRRSFGICNTCRFNTNPSGQKFVCGLTKESLSKEETQLVCREHEVQN